MINWRRRLRRCSRRGSGEGEGADEVEIGGAMANVPLARPERPESGEICKRAKEPHDDTTIGSPLSLRRVPY
jgi:hypothetical protein